MANSFPANVILSSDKFADVKQVAAQLSRYSHDFSPEVASGGTGVRVWYQNSATASQWTVDGKFSTTEESIPSADVNIGEPYYKAIHLTPNEQNSYGEAFLQKRIGPPIIAVLNKIKGEVQNQLTASIHPLVGPNAAITASAMSFDSVLSGSSVLIGSGSVGPITLLASNNAYTALIKEAKAANYTITSTVSEGQPSFRYSLLPQVLIVQEPSMVNYSVMTTPDGAAVALRTPPQLSGYNRSVIVDSDLNVAIPVDLVEDTVGGTIQARASLSAGFGPGRPGAAVRYWHGNT
jgi:hypothetical protein